MTTKTTTMQRAIARSLIVFLVGSQIAQQVHATDIADVPMAVKNPVVPNVMFTLDDSGSMQFETIPEIDDVYLVFPRPATLYGGSYYDSGTFDTLARFEEDNRYARYFRTAKFNKLYYDPAKRYVPWSNADGSLMANAVPAAAYHNPNAPGEGSLNLTADFTYNGWWKNDNGGKTRTSRTYYPATYFIYSTTGPELTGPTDSRNTQARFTKVEIKPTTTFPTKASGRTDCAGARCTYDEEIQNFANWYTYYRSRILAARAGVGRAFARQPESMRVGFAAINKGSSTIDGANSPGTVVRGVRVFSGTNRSNFFANLYGHVMPTEGTPLRTAIDDVGQYFKRSDDRGPWGENPGSTGGTQYACRQSYHILTTDGYWTGGNAYDARTTGARANVDGTAGATISKPSTPTPTPPNTFTYAAGNPYSDSWSNTLADVAMYYWVNDLRTDLPNRVPTHSKDPAFWQHMVNFTVGLGVNGTVPADKIASAFTTTPQTITWPDPTGAEAHKVDDLAHAAVNSRGGYFNAADPDAFATALTDALDDIVGRDGAAAAVAVANANITDDNASYSSRYHSGTWTGDLFAYPISLTTGLPDESNPLWARSAQAQLDSRTSSDRKIVTYSGSTGIQFQPTTATTTSKLSAAQQTLLNTPGLTDGAAVVAYLRGDTSAEGTTYRTRSHLLGDIVNAEPVVLTKPRANYTDDGYAAFKTAKASRPKMVFQGANDGMLHAFDAASGAEAWAYIPNLLFGTLNNLSLKTGFTHKYYVDGTPFIGEVDFRKTDGSTATASDWRSILVGGLGKGGRGYYALDVTTPTLSGGTNAAKEADAASKVLWEFPNAGNKDTALAGDAAMTYGQIMGYSMGEPVIVKTKAHGWVVLVTSGYNNGTDTGGNGQGYLIVLNARTGAVIKTLGTGVGTSADPSGLGQLSAYVENPDIDNTTDFVYGGDLKGNLWRFDLSGADSSTWTVKKLAALVDSDGNIQPITTAPELGKFSVDNGSFKRMVYVGTGQYLGDSDVPGGSNANIHASQKQTVYGLVDDLSVTPLINPLRANLQQQTFTTDTSSNPPTRKASSNGVNWATQRGWYMDLTAGERINVDPSLGTEVLTFVSNIPNSDRCLPGGSSWVTSLDYKTGGFVEGSNISYSSILLGDVLGSRAVLIKTSDGKIRGLVRKSDATTVTVTIPTRTPTVTVRRVSWRELPDQ